MQPTLRVIQELHEPDRPSTDGLLADKAIANFARRDEVVATIIGRRLGPELAAAWLANRRTLDAHSTS